MIAGPHSSSMGNNNDLKKDFDASLKGNVFYMDGHKVIMPAVNSSATDSNKTS